MDNQSDGPQLRGEGEQEGTPTESSGRLSVKKARKRLRDEEHLLRRALQRYRDALKKAKHDLGSVPASHDREKLKKAEWMYESVKHYLEETEKKQSADDVVLSDSFHASVEKSIADLKHARKSLRG